MADVVVLLLNRERTNAGLVPLRRSSLLDRSAAIKANDLITRHYWAHAFDRHESPWQVFNAVVYDYHFSGENLARDFTTSPAVVNAWMLSPEHKANMLKPEFREIGAAAMDGRITGPAQSRVVVAHFGARR